MPLVVRNANVSSYYKGTTAQESTQTFSEGDLWYNTQTDIVKSYNGSTLNNVATTSFSGAAVVSHSTTIGDYTTPSNSVESSNASTTTQTFDTSGTVAVVNMTTTDSRCGEKVTSTTTQGKQIYSMTMALKSASGATGTIVYVIRKSSDNSIVATSTQSLDASTITTSIVSYTLNFNAETIPSETYYAVAEGIASGQIEVIGTLSDTSANGATSYWSGAAWNDLARDTRVTITYYVSNVVDNNTGTKWTSNSENNPNTYVDMGSALNLCAIAIYYDSTGTETEVKIQSSADALTWTDKRKITTSNLTNGAWNYYRFNIAGGARYVRVYGTGTSKTLSIWEIKVLKKTDAEIFADLGILEIDATDTTLIGAGT